MPFIPNVPGVPALASYLTEPLPLLLTDTVLALSQGLNSLQWGIYDQFGVPVIASALSPLFDLGSLITDLNEISAALIGQQLTNQFSVVDFEYKQDWNISNAPVESGGFQSYNKVQLPFDVRMRVAAGGSVNNRQSLLTVVDNLANSGLSAGIPGIPSVVSNILTSPGLLSGLASTVAGSILGLPTSIPLYSVLTPEKIYNSVTVSHYDYRRSNVNGVGLLVVDIWLTEVRVTSSATYSNTLSPVNAGSQAIGNVQPSSSFSLSSILPQ